MTLILNQLGIAIFLFTISMIAALYPLKQSLSLKSAYARACGEVFSSGIFLGAAFFHLLPDAIAMCSQLYPLMQYPLAEALCIVGFLLLVFLESLCKHYPHLPTTSPTHWIPYILATALMIHAIIEGAALGLNNTVYETAMLALAIIAHKSSESFALGMTLTQLTLPIKLTKIIILLFSLMTPLGIAIGATLHSMNPNGPAIIIFNAFAAGTFLYIATLHSPYHHHYQNLICLNAMTTFMWLIIGVSIMAIIPLFT